MSTYNIISPGDSSVYKICDYQTKEQSLTAIENAKVAQKSWKKTTITQRQEFLTKFVDSLVADKVEICKELAFLIGRPLKQNQNEVNGFEARARHLIKIAPEALRDTIIEDSTEFRKFMTREALGVILIISAWNYPYLVSVNGVIPAILAGNTVILKQAPQTFPVADRFLKHFQNAGLPKHVFQVLQADLKEVAEVVKSPDVNYIHFTGSFRGGSQVRKLASDRFCGQGFELGGNDPAYVREDCDVINAAENLVDGAMYNSGQSCCGIERGIFNFNF
jgi:acyl-CoA reductase-like NAD-dependent aldehyde dehydrogenase